MSFVSNVSFKLFVSPEELTDAVNFLVVTVFSSTIPTIEKVAIAPLFKEILSLKSPVPFAFGQLPVPVVIAQVHS